MIALVQVAIILLDSSITAKSNVFYLKKVLERIVKIIT